SHSTQWIFNKLEGNLKGVAMSTSNLVTKHVVKGHCHYFSQYIAQHEDKRAFFQPLLDAYAPSVLSKESFIKDFLKYSTPIIIGEVDCSIFESALKFLIHKMESLNFGECNFVTDTDSIFQSLNMKAAVGALYSGKKRDYFSEFTDTMKDDIIFESCKRLYCGKMGIWNGSLKAELRSKEKVLLKKTRTFTSAPIDSLLAGKVCVDDFNNRFYDLFLQGPWTVGISKFMKGWHALMEKLPEGWIYCDADGSRFDSSLSPYLINSVLRVRSHFMERWEVGLQMLSNFYTEVIYTPILVPDGTVVKKFKGNNSGQPSTVVDNSLMVIMAVYYALAKNQIELQTSEEKFVFFVNGDDLLIAVHPMFEHILENFRESFATLGLDYDFSSRHRSKSDIWFMSHNAILKDGIYIPKLEKERIVSILQWDRSSEPIHRAEAICAAMIEAWGYDELLREIRLFYHWLVTTQPAFIQLDMNGTLPYLSESALRNLYVCEQITDDELRRYLEACGNINPEDHDCVVVHQ
nr:NIb [Dendrobium chlorotic mosaic virus]